MMSSSSIPQDESGNNRVTQGWGTALSQTASLIRLDSWGVQVDLSHGSY